MQILSLFSGIGGFDLAARWMGWETVAFCEIDPFCRRVLAKHWPDVPIHEDIRTLDRECLDMLIATRYPYETLEDNQMAGKLKKLSLAQAEESVRLYDAGLSCGAIAAFYGVSRQSMWDLLRRRTQLRDNKRFGEDNHFYRGGTSADGHAHNLVEAALKIGTLSKPGICENCGCSGKFRDGRSAIQAHHCDYNKPLEVMWLCQKCHHKWHSTYSPIRKEVMPTEAPQIDMIVGGFP